MHCKRDFMRSFAWVRKTLQKGTATSLFESNNTSCKRDFCDRLLSFFFKTWLLFGVLLRKSADVFWCKSIFGVKETLLSLRLFLLTSLFDPDVAVPSDKLMPTPSVIKAPKLSALPRLKESGFHSFSIALQSLLCEVRKWPLSSCSAVGKRFIGLSLCNLFLPRPNLLRSDIFLFLSAWIQGALGPVRIRWRGGVIGWKVVWLIFGC